MSLKIGDKVKMTPRGFKFYSDIDLAFEGHSIAGRMESEHFTKAVCELFAIHGIGTVKEFSDGGIPYIVFTHSLDGIKYKYSQYLDEKDVKKISFLDKIIFKIKKLI